MDFVINFFDSLFSPKAQAQVQDVYCLNKKFKFNNDGINRNEKYKLKRK